MTQVHLYFREAALWHVAPQHWSEDMENLSLYSHILTQHPIQRHTIPPATLLFASGPAFGAEAESGQFSTIKWDIRYVGRAAPQLAKEFRAWFIDAECLELPEIVVGVTDAQYFRGSILSFYRPGRNAIFSQIPTQMWFFTPSWVVPG